MTRKAFRPTAWIFLLLGALALFGAGLLFLRLNPYWRPEPEMPGVYNPRVFLWNGVCHLICGLGLISVFGSVLGLGSCAFRTKWMYWLVACLAVIAYVMASGATQLQVVHYNWDTRIGMTDITIDNPQDRISQAIIDWQVQPELVGYWRPLSNSRPQVRISDVRIYVTVVRIVPIAIPDRLDCDCFHCCNAEDIAANLKK